MYDICLTVSAWCIIGLLGVLFISSARREISRPGAAVFRGTLFFLPYFAASTSTPT